MSWQFFLALVKHGHRNLLLVPVAFVKKHIEKLHKLDIVYVHKLVQQVGTEKIARRDQNTKWKASLINNLMDGH